MGRDQALSGPNCKTRGLWVPFNSRRRSSRGPAAAVVLDDEQVTAVGERAKRFPVTATVNGYSWRTTVTRMRGEFLLGVNREVGEAAGVEAGDTVDVAIELDAAPREVDVPKALASALAADPAASAAFDGLAFTHRKEYARWVVDCQARGTRDRRVTQAVQMLREGKGSADDSARSPNALPARTRAPAGVDEMFVRRATCAPGSLRRCFKIVSALAGRWQIRVARRG